MGKNPIHHESICRGCLPSLTRVADDSSILGITHLVGRLATSGQRDCANEIPITSIAEWPSLAPLAAERI